MSRLKGKPFEILAIALDDTRAEVLHLLESKNMPGIHTWDEKGPENPIAEQYNVIGLPTWYLLDEKGVIRARDPYGRELIPAVEAIVGPAGNTQSNSDADRSTPTVAEPPAPDDSP